MEFQQRRQEQLLRRIGDFSQSPEQRGFENGRLVGEIALCSILLAGGDALALYTYEQLRSAAGPVEPLSYQRPDPTDFTGVTYAE